LYEFAIWIHAGTKEGIDSEIDESVTYYSHTIILSLSLIAVNGINQSLSPISKLSHDNSVCRGYRRVKHLVQQNVLTGVRQETRSANDEEGSCSSNHHVSSFARFCCIFEGPSGSRRCTGGSGEGPRRSRRCTGGSGGSFAEGVVVFGGVNVLRDATTPHITRYLTIVGAVQRNHLREITTDPRRTCIVGSMGSLACIAAGLSAVQFMKGQ